MAPRRPRAGMAYGLAIALALALALLAAWPDAALAVADVWSDSKPHAAFRAAQVVSIEGVWERGHVGGSVGVEVAPVPGGTLVVVAGLDGFLDTNQAFVASVHEVAWRQAFSSWGQDLTVQVGKSAHALGRGRIDALLSSGSPPGYPSLAYTVAGNRYRYDKVIGDLATEDQRYKRVVLHRLDYALLPNLSVGIAEVSVRSAPHPGDLFYDLVPALPLYLVKYLPGGKSIQDNQLIQLDAELRLDDAVVYGEAIFNEFPAVPGVETNPPLYGLLVGVEYGPWLAEYSRLTNYAYSNRDRGTVYDYDGRPLGHRMGADGDAFEVRWHHELSPAWRMYAGGFLWRKGEGEVGDWYSSSKERKENAFLSGVVETTRGVSFGLARAADRYELRGDVRAGLVDNDGHVEGDRGYWFEAKVGVSYWF